MYHLTTPLREVHGIGPKLTEELALGELFTVQDLLLCLPLRYIDYSEFATIATAVEGAAVTIAATVQSVTQFRKNGRVMSRAQISDESGTMSLWWFNTSFIKQSLKKGENYLFSGVVGKQKSMVHPLFERAELDGETLHTGRLVPVYSSTIPIMPGKVRRLCKEITDHLELPPDFLDTVPENTLPSRQEALQELHFPKNPDSVTAARERLALEEFLGIMRLSHHIKTEWAAHKTAHAVQQRLPIIPQLPFSLTAAQERSIAEILTDLQSSVPMNRLLLGDVGSGKTIVAGIVARQIIFNCNSVALIAPTKILAEQHAATLRKLLPELSVELVQAGQKIDKELANQPKVWVGTHALLNRLEAIQPALLIYDEQHRFGVIQRSAYALLKMQPHVLTMTATPIPRTLLLTLFSHLQVSILDELPANRIPTKTWILPSSKRSDMHDWLIQQVRESEHRFQTLVVCPFIDTSESEGLAAVAAATEKYTELRKLLPKDIVIGLLHGKQTPREKTTVIDALFAGNIDLLVTTPIVEVGIDLPQASAMIIESAERYGLASLHQLRGRVGRAGQQGYCILYPTKPGSAKERLQLFSETLSGQKLAELDLQSRGAGELFGVAQSGFGSLRFANWANLPLVALAQRLFSELPADWVPLIIPAAPDSTPGAN